MLTISDYNLIIFAQVANLPLIAQTDSNAKFSGVHTIYFLI
jgi:hypothetical protein